ncbi:MAG: hypothetical protein NTX26_02720 [Candidatus Parcubacteria bacterium]|nr:hypothetical protein [Candidatus Parcubacteria bacterium]
MKRFSKIFCIALIAIVFFSIGFSAKAESCTTATPVVFIEAQMIPEKGVTCTVKSCARYCYTAEFIKQIFKDLDTNSTLTNYARKLDNSKSPNWSLDTAAISDVRTVIDNYKSQVQGACKKDKNTPTDTTDYNNCVAAWDYLTDYWSSFLSTPLPQSKDFYETDQYKNLKDYVETKIVEPGYIDLVPTNPINTDNRPTQAATTQNNADCANDTPGGFLDCIKDPPLCFFKYINLGIIHSTAFVIKMGVNTMGWLMQPNNLWAPGISNNPAVIQAFGASVSVVNIVFSVVLVMMAIGTILNLKSYKINDLITKFIIVALLINFTLVIAGSILDLANYISLYFYNATLKSIQSGTLTDKWTEILTNNVCLSGWFSSIGRMFVSIFINLLVLIAIGAAMLSVCGSLLKRGIMLMFLLIISPFAVICYLLPAKGMGQWWEKWKTSFLQQTFYGVYVSVGFYLGTIMLSALSISNQSSDIELSFASGLIKPILAAGYLVFIVLLADEVAGGSAKASITGATKLALGVAGGAALAGAMRAKTALTTSEGFTNLASKLNTTKGFGWMGKSALKIKDTGLSQRAKQNEAENEIVNARTTDSNIARFNTLAASKVTAKSQREMASIASKLVSEHRFQDISKEARNAYVQLIPQIYSEKNIATGIISKDLKSKAESALPNLFVSSNSVNKFRRRPLGESGIATNVFDETLVNNNNDFEKTMLALMKTGTLGPNGNNPEVEKALGKYYDKQRDIFVDFKTSSKEADADAMVQTLTGPNVDDKYKLEIISRLASNPKVLARILEQVGDSTASTGEIKNLDILIQKYINPSAPNLPSFPSLGAHNQPQYMPNEIKYFAEYLPRFIL